MTDVPDAIDRYSDVELWGVTPSSVLAANYALTDASKPGETDWTLLRQQHDLWVLRTNYQPSWESYRAFLSDLAKMWLEQPLHQAAVFVKPDQYSQFITGSLYHNGSDGIIRLLNWACQQYDPETPDNQIVIGRQEVSQFADQSDIRVLASIDAVTYTPEGYVFDPATIEALTAGLHSDRSQAAWALLERCVERMAVDTSETVIRELLSALDFPVPDDPPADTAGSIPIYVLSRSLEPLITDLFGEELMEAIHEVQNRVDTQIENLEESLRVDFVTAEQVQDVSWPLSETGAAVCAIASQRGLPVAADWVKATEGADDIFAVHARLQDAGVDVTLHDRLLTFEVAYTAPTAPKSALEEYQTWLDQEIETLQDQHRVLAAVSREVGQLMEKHRSEIVEQSMAQLDQCDVRPTTFVYTMLDPERLKQYSVEKYVGESSHLEDEMRWIRQWRDDEPLDARPYASVLPEVISYPLEHESAKPELRIMSPWFNFALQDYVALFNRLLENGVQVKMLFRLPTFQQWNRMQSRFFQRIGETHGNLQLRTYTRYREYREHSELADIEDSEDEYLDEFGVHAKMYIAGDRTDGTLLTGSANLVENSLHFNPEVGIHAHDPNLIETARSYFDVVWRLAEADKIPEKVMFGEVPFKFYPKVYEP
jgi:hypothetical protein